jgi:predicted nuclease with TOPRIM domain
VFSDTGAGLAGGAVMSMLLQLIYKLVMDQKNSGNDKDVAALRDRLTRVEADVERVQEYVREAERALSDLRGDVRTLLASQPPLDKIMDLLARIRSVGGTNG